MGVKCSLFGHDYGDTDIERERAERGDEVVRTAKRVERCRSCGHGRTVSENTEVTTLEAAAGVVREPDGTIVAATDSVCETRNESSESEQTVGLRTSSNERGESDSVSTEGGGSLNEQGDFNGGVVEKLTTANAPDSSDVDETGPVDETDDTGDIDEIPGIGPEIRNTGPSRAPGEWPSEPNDEPTRTLNSGTHRNSVGLGPSGSLAVAQMGANQWPGETDAVAESQAEPQTATNGSGPGTAGTSTRADRPGNAFTCPSCGFSAAVTDSPLRAGDICPGCHHGYLAWETRKG